MYVTVILQNAWLVYKLSWNWNLIELKLLMLSCVNMSLTVGITVITIFFISTKNSYNNTLETNRVSAVYSYNITVILRLQYVVPVMLFPMIKILYVYIITVSKHVRSAQYGCFMYLLHVVLSSYVFHKFHKWFWDGCNCPYY
jgi:hypothetical protein